MQHSKISPSHSKRWMNCPGSIILSEKCPEPEQSVYAAEGQAAHDVAAECLKRNEDAHMWIGETIETPVKNFRVTEKMADYIQIYLDAVRDDMRADGVKEKYLMVEQKIKLPFIDEKLFGTLDASYPNPFGVLKIYDLKYGRGTFVEVDDNSQLLIYLLGAYYKFDKLYDEMEIVVVQPRYENEDISPVRRATVKKSELMQFKKELQDACKRINKKDDTLQVGKWCKFCPAMAICPKKKEEIFEKLPAKQPNKLPDPSVLSAEKLGEVLSVADQIRDYAKACHKRAQILAEAGSHIPGFKLIKRRGNRRWIDEIAVETAFEAEHGDMIYDKKLKSPAQLEKIVGKDNVQEYVERPDLGLSLVHESARGEPVQKTDKVFKKIENKEKKNA